MPPYGWWCNIWLDNPNGTNGDGWLHFWLTAWTEEPRFHPNPSDALEAKHRRQAAHNLIRRREKRKLVRGPHRCLAKAVL